MDLAQMNHKHLPRWLELFIYVIAEACIICTDLSQVIGTAIALNILIPQLPLPAGCAISVVETLFVLLFYTPEGKLRRIRLFEYFVAILVLVMFVTICVALSMVSAEAGPVFRGFVPSREIFVDQGLYDSCAILGGTLMPHALYVGTALSRARLFDFDSKHEMQTPPVDDNNSTSSERKYRPSLRAIKNCLHYSVAELAFTLFTVAIFVNSALVIISGAAFYNVPSGDNSILYGGNMRDDDDDGDGSSAGAGTGATGSGAGSNATSATGGGSVTDVSGDLYDLYNLFSSEINPAAGTIFAVSLLFSGISAGIVATMAGQIIMEGALNLRISPFLRRMVTRLVAIIPALVIGASLGKDGLSKALVACNYVLAIGLIFVSFPLVYYTSRTKYMQVPTDDGTGTVSMKNSLINTIFAWFIWALVVFMDVATVVLVGLGLSADDG
jgi:metal iron transporter